MGLADDLESNLDDLYQQTVRTNAQDAFNVAIAATVRSVVNRSAPALQIVRTPAAAASSASTDGSVSTTSDGRSRAASATSQPARGAGVSHPFSATEPAAGEQLETPDAELAAAAAKQAAAQAAARNTAAR